MAIFTDRQLQFMYNHKIATFICFAIIILLVLAALLLGILTLIYGPDVLDVTLWF